MKVLHVVPTYVPAYRYGGPIHSVHALNKYLVRAGAEVTVYATAIDGPRNLDVPIGVPVDVDGVQVYYFRPGRPRSWFYSPEMAQSLQDHTREFDVVHITSVFLAASTIGARAARAAERPYFISPRGSLMRAPLARKSSLKKSLYMRLLERKNLERAAAVHFTTAIERQEYEEAGLPLNRAVVIPNGLDPDSLPPGDPQEFRGKFGISQEKKIVLFLGRLSWKKGLDILVPAFAKAVKELPDAVLVIAGGDDENYKSKLDKLIDRARIRDKVVLTGPLAGTDRSAAYQAASVFALPSYAENFAATVAEAMYFGVPVIVSKDVGLAPEVERAGAGVIIPKDVNQVAAALSEFLKDSDRTEAAGNAGRAYALENFSYDRVAANFLAEYETIARWFREKSPKINSK